MKTKKIKMLRNTKASGKPCAKGKVVQVSESDAKTLIRMGRAVDVSGKDDKQPQEDAAVADAKAQEDTADTEQPEEQE